MKHPKNFRVVNLLMLTVAGIVNAFGITIFLTPVKLYDSGISGTSMLLEQITPPYLSLSFFTKTIIQPPASKANMIRINIFVTNGLAVPGNRKALINCTV